MPRKSTYLFSNKEKGWGEGEEGGEKGRLEEGIEAKEGSRQDGLKTASFNCHKFQYVLKECVLNIISALTVYPTKK